MFCVPSRCSPLDALAYAQLNNAGEPANARSPSSLLLTYASGNSPFYLERAPMNSQLLSGLNLVGGRLLVTASYFESREGCYVSIQLAVPDRWQRTGRGEW